MPRKFPKPFFRTGRGWYVQLGKEQIKLAEGPENSDTQAEALARYHELMAERGRQAPISAISAGPVIAEVLDKYLTWCKNHSAKRTYDWYLKHIQGFLNHAGNLATQPITDLKPFHIVEWVDSHGDAWSNAYRRGVMTAEDEQADGTKHARANVIHEAGLFQGRLGFERAIILLEEGCSEFSNIVGLGQIRFPKGSIMATSEEIRRVLEREKIL